MFYRVLNYRFQVKLQVFVFLYKAIITQYVKQHHIAYYVGYNVHGFSND